MFDQITADSQDPVCIKFLMSAYIEIFKVLEIIIRKYTRQPARQMMDNYLRIKIIVHINFSSVDSTLEEIGISKAERVIFGKRSSQKAVFLVCIAIDHAKYFDLSDKMMETMKECIIINPSMNQINNLLNIYQPQGEHLTKAILFKIERINFEELTQNLDAYLSICELFHSHTHMIVNCFEASGFVDLKAHVCSVDEKEDQFDGMSQDGYFRILEERASRITLEELSDSCELNRSHWGQTLIFQGGNDGIIIWLTQNFLPKIQHIPQVSMPSSKEKILPLFIESPIGFKIYKNKKVFKEKLENLNFTTIIFNLKRYEKDIETAISEQFTEYTKKFFSNFAASSELSLLSQNIKHGERICNILGIDYIHLIKRLLTL